MDLNVFTKRDPHALMANIHVASQQARLLLISGDRHDDRFLMDGRIVALRNPVSGALPEMFQNIKAFSASSGTVASVKGEGSNAQPSQGEIASLLASLGEQGPEALIIEATLLFEDPGHPSAQDLQLVRRIDACCRDASRQLSIVLTVDKPVRLPDVLRQAGYSRSISLPGSSQDERHSYISIRSKALAERAGMGVKDIADSLSVLTEGWRLSQLDHLIRVAAESDSSVSSLQDLEHLATVFERGVINSPWAGQRMNDIAKSAPTFLSQRVKGQPEAIKAFVRALQRSVIGLSASTKTGKATTPKGVFFLAGPTGTGKTELVKSLASLLFGDEGRVIRFDCSELAQEHASARLLGAPPGYVGFEAGGELTEAIKKQPCSIVLFDEVEKGHPRLLDALLQVLDDGRLTDGRGETAFFTESLIVFTSNLGMHTTNGSGMRQLAFDYDTPYETLQTGVRDAIADEFVSRLGRPELLGRIGGKEAIVVFDYIRDVEGVVAKFLSNINSRLQQLHQIELVVHEDVVVHITQSVKARPDLLELGGRGIAKSVEDLVVDPLASLLFELKASEGATRIVAQMETTGIVFDFDIKSESEFHKT